MNIKRLFYGILSCFLFLFPSLAGASTIITDNYWGGRVFQASPTQYGDTIGAPYFDVAQMEVSKEGTNWTVKLTGAYFSNHLNSSVDSGFPFKLGPGDLYINSAGWNATTGLTDHYETDTFNSGEGWNYVVSQKQNAAGDWVWGLYTLNYATITNTNVASLGNENGYIFRKDQAWMGGAGTLVGVGDATYNNSLSGQYLTFTFNTGGITVPSEFSSAVGFHWTMRCGNDVIEGKYTVPTGRVPEPATMLLLGLGLLGVAAIRRKF